MAFIDRFQAVASRSKIACILAILLCLPLQSFAAEAIGYVWPKTDVLMPDPTKGEFKPLQNWRHYDVVKQTHAGYIVVWQNMDGTPRLALIPFRDRMGNPTADPNEPAITLKTVFGIGAQPGFIPFNAGDNAHNAAMQPTYELRPEPIRKYMRKSNAGDWVFYFPVIASYYNVDKKARVPEWEQMAVKVTDYGTEMRIESVKFVLH